jgi:hypothetical protein
VEAAASTPAAAATPAGDGKLRALAAVLLVGLLGASSAPASPPVGDVLQAIGNARKGLTSYIVPVTMHGSVHVKIVSVPFSMHGTEYYQAPDKQASTTLWRTDRFSSGTRTQR